MKQSVLFPAKRPIVFADGLGVDSTGELILLRNLGIIPDLILFADTGAEKQETYDYEQNRQAWLKKNGFPPLIVVRYVPKDFKNWPPYYTLEDNCLTNGTLPGISFGPASCSIKWKQQPQNSYCKSWQPAKDCWDSGEKVIKLIGFDAGPIDRRRTFPETDSGRGMYEYRYPLVEAGWDRQRCIEEIKKEGEEVPPKSSCFFCLAMKTHEVDKLPANYLRRIVRMEARAKPRLHTCEGLWRSTVKGCRGATPRPGSMTDYIRSKGLLPQDEVDEIWENTPKDIVEFQEGYSESIANGSEMSTETQKKDYRSIS